MPEPVSPPSAPARTKRRLVPDLDNKIEVGGARLVRVKREPLPPPPRSLDELSKKHAGPAEAEPIADAPAPEEEEADEEHAEFVAALRGGPEPSPGIADHAHRLELFTSDPTVFAEPPHPETNPDKRAEGGLSPLILTSDAPDYLASREKPETLLDLFSLFPIDGVNWFIYVNRTEPKLYLGIIVRGVQRPVTRVLSFAEWQNIYGGGAYELTVYGPPKNGLIVNADGRVSPKKMTEPIKMNFPGEPSVRGMVHEGEDPMNQELGVVDFPSRGGPRTMADANVESKKVEVTAQREIRQESREEKERNRNETLLKEKAIADQGMMAMFLASQAEARKNEAELQRQMIAREREFAEERERMREETEERLRRLEGDKKPDELERLIGLSTAMTKGGGSIDTLRQEHAREIERIQEQRSRDQENFNTQIRDNRERADRMIAEERERSERRIKDSEERLHVQARDAMERAAAEVQRAKDECEKRLNDQHRQHLDRVADLDRNHARDLAGKEASHSMAIETVKMTYDLRLDQAKGDVKRATTDIERYRKEADENKDVIGKIAEFKAQAAELGMVDASEAGGSEPETIPQMLMKVGANVAGSLPQIIDNISTMMRGKNEQEAAQAHARGRQEALQQLAQQNQGFAPTLALPAAHQRRGAPRLAPLPPIGQAHQAPLIPGHEPGRRDPRSASIRPISDQNQQPEEVMRRDMEARLHQSQQALAESAVMQAPMDPGPVALPGENPFHTGMPPEPQYVEPAPLQAMPPPAAPAAQSPSLPPPALGQDPAHAAAVLQEDQQIISTEMFLLPNFQAGDAPSTVAKGILMQAGPEQVQQMLTMLGSADRVIVAFERLKGPDHPFVRRDGKKFLRGLFTELGKLTR